MVGKKKSTKETKAKKVSKTSNGVTLETPVFKDMVARARKGASNNSILFLTSLMCIELKDNKLTLITTDGTNYFYVMQNDVEGDDFYVTVVADTFAQLVAKTTSDKITLELDGTSLKVKANGEYKMELPEEEGELIKFPDPRNEVELEPLDDIELITVKSIVDTAKSSLAVTFEEPCYVNYYCGDGVIATDTIKMCLMDIQLWEEARLIPAEVFDLVYLMTDEKIKVSAKDDIIMFSTSDCVVYGRTADGLDDFAMEAIGGLSNIEFPSTCKVKRSDVLQLLDRLSLFVSKTDKNEVYLTFTEEGMEVSSKKSTGVEVVPYIDSEGFEEFTCTIDILMLQTQIKASADDAITIHYGMYENDNGEKVSKVIKFVDGTAEMFIALIEDDRSE